MRLKSRQPRERSDRHLDFIRSLPCAVCGNDVQTEAAHIRMGSLRHGKRHTGMQEKPADRWTVPLCGKHHREQHMMAEDVFWQTHHIDPLLLALLLFTNSGDDLTCRQIIVLNRHAA